MSKHQNKAGLMEDIRVQRSRLENNLAVLSPEELVTPGLVGDWSAKDVMAHLIDWEQRFIGWCEAGQRSEVVETPAPGMTWRQLDQLNQQIYEQYKDLPLEEVRARFAESYQQILALLESTPESDLFSTGFYPWLKDGRLADWAAANTCNHYYWAKTQIRKGLKAHA